MTLGMRLSTLLGAVVVMVCPAALAAEPADVGQLAGEWRLDLEASSDPVPALERLDVSWVVRKAARSVRPRNRIDLKDGTLTNVMQSLIVTRTVTQKLDGATPTQEDFFGYALTYTSVVEGGAVVSRGSIDLKKDGKAPVELRREVQPDGRMTLTIKVSPPEEQPLEIVRVFNRER
jgi:hypothetical protein